MTTLATPCETQETHENHDSFLTQNTRKSISSEPGETMHQQMETPHEPRILRNSINELEISNVSREVNLNELLRFK